MFLRIGGKSEKTVESPSSTLFLGNVNADKNELSHSLFNTAVSSPMLLINCFSTKAKPPQGSVKFFCVIISEFKIKQIFVSVIHSFSQFSFIFWGKISE